MDAYRWRIEILMSAMTKIALTGNEVAKEAILRVACQRGTIAETREQVMLDMLEKKPMGVTEMMEAMQLKRFPAEQILLRLRTAKKVYLYDFEKSGVANNGLRKIWAAGDCPDAVYTPKRIRKHNPSKSIRVQSAKQVKKDFKVTMPSRDPLVSAFFGPR